ncbi:MAG TPA: hypothetical protein VN034_14315 [Sphingopyxis sp.]|nr:hypothetical protein [Sphingopyxis sp.]
MRLALSIFFSLIIATSSAQARIAYVPFVMKEDFGIRPVVDARIDDTAVALAVHSGAAGLIELTPEAADALGYHDRIYAGQYGIDRSGHLASAGASRVRLGTLTIGPNITSPALAFVHALPGNKADILRSGKAGMLGIKWLRSSRAFVDFGGKRIGFPQEANDTASARARLTEAGYTALPMIWNEKEAAYTVNVRLSGHSANLIVNTVSAGYLDLPSSQAAGLVFGEQTGTAGGPKGATVPVYKPLAPLSIEIGGRHFPGFQPPAWDTGAYLSRSSAAEGAPAPGPIQGALGATFWIARAAVIDFGGGWLFLAPSK